METPSPAKGKPLMSPHPMTPMDSVPIQKPLKPYLDPEFLAEISHAGGIEAANHGENFARLFSLI